MNIYPLAEVNKTNHILLCDNEFFLFYLYTGIDTTIFKMSNLTQLVELPNPLDSLPI